MSKPTYGNGKICYLEIPALNVQQSSAFYEKVFGWHIRSDNAGNVTFDDAVGEVSGMWATGMEPGTRPGVIISIMVYDMQATLKLVLEEGGKILREPHPQASEKTAHFSDPAGNVFGLYEHKERA